MVEEDSDAASTPMSALLNENDAFEGADAGASAGAGNDDMFIES